MSIKRIVSIIGLLSLVGWSGAGAAGVPTILDVAVETRGTGQVDRAFVLDHVGSRAGDELNTARVSNDVKALLATGRFTTVDAGIEQQTGGVRLIFTVRPKYRLAADPTIVGRDHLSRRKVRALLNLRTGDLVDDQVMGSRTRALIDEYRDDHYVDAKCSWSISVVDEAEGLATVTLTIDEGRKAVIRKIRLEGNSAVSSGALRGALHRPAPWNVFRWVWPKPYERQELAGIEAEVKGVYMDMGYLEAQAAAHVETAESGRQVAVVEVTEGPQYTISAVDVTGITIFPEAEVRGLVRLESGQIASYRQIALTGAALGGYYGDRGYLDSDARPVLVPDAAAHTVAITYEMAEGELVSLRNILVRGNTRTKDKVIRRELLVYPGETYNQRRVERSQRRLQNLGFFETVRAIPLPTDESDERDLVFDVTEKRTGQFMLGAGFSSIDRMIGFVELSQGNFDIGGWPFTGGGQKLRLRAQFGSTRQDYEISFTEPWFLDRRLSLGFDLYRRNRNYSDYDEERTGAAVTLGKALPGANRISLKYQIEQSIINDIADTNVYYDLDSYDFATQIGADPYYFQSEEDRITSSLTLSLVHDTRDNPFVPTSGNRLTASYAITGGPLGFDTDTYELGLRTAHYLPLWFRHVISLRTQFRVIEAFGDTDVVPLADRLFLGGGRSLRGYDYRDVGPKVIRPYTGTDIYIHRPRGGQSLATASVEYTIPIVEGIRLAGFYDIGNAWLDAYEFDFSKMASAAGIGIRLDMPGFPIRIDRAWTIEKDDNFTNEDPWVIWIGYDY